MFLIINAGSTSIKTSLLDQGLLSVALLSAEFHSESGSIVKKKNLNGVDEIQRLPELRQAQDVLAWILAEWCEILSDSGLILSACGHRIVHGGNEFGSITRLDRELLDRIASLDAYAPLHNPLNRLGVELALTRFPDVPHYAVFDTAFHRSMPDHARCYAIPRRLSQNVEFCRFGFHGISCQHSLEAAAKLLDRKPESLNAIILHLGGGASATAVRQGVSIDTSMGFSPTEGLIMAERCGDLDPMISITLIREGWTPDRLDRCLNHDGGLKALCGSGDMRRIQAQAQQGDRASLAAMTMYCYRIKKYIGAYCAILGEVAAVIFTGGIGEHSPLIREQVMQGLEGLGMIVNVGANRQELDADRDVSAAGSRTAILVLRAQEEREIARQIVEFEWQQ